MFLNVKNKMQYIIFSKKGERWPSMGEELPGGDQREGGGDAEHYHQ